MSETLRLLISMTGPLSDLMSSIPFAQVLQDGLYGMLDATDAFIQRFWDIV